MRGVVRVLVWLSVIVAIWFLSFTSFVYSVHKLRPNNHSVAQGIIVLTGGSGRVEYGLELLARGRGNALFISGVGESVPLADMISKAPESVRDILGVLSLGKITLGRYATNTIGNAEESVEWVRARNYKTILLVTADYHMPRSLIEFKALLPEVKFIPAVVETQHYEGLGWLKDAETRNLLLSEFHKLIAAKLRHKFFAPDAGK